MQLKPSYDVDGSAYSAACKAILKAGQTYGFYIGDTGDESIQLQMLNDNVYKHDPSHPVNAAETVFNQLLAAGDAKGTYSEGGGSWSNCFQRLQSSDFQILELSPP
jgi:hypothetical protein